MAARHRPIPPRAPRRAATGLAFALLAAALCVVGLVVFTVVNGELRLPFGGGVVFAFDRQPAAPEPRQPEGTVAVLACPTALPAFTRLSREHLFGPTGLHTVPVVEAAIAANGLFRADADGVQRLLGRVLKRPKPVDFAFSEQDLLPAGTRPGPSAGVPPGTRGVWIDLATVQGLADARAGDTVDLVAAKTVDAAPPPDTTLLDDVSDPVLRARLLQAAAIRTAGPAVRSWVVARAALVVAPPRRRERSATPARRGQAPDMVEEVFVAMTPDEVARWSQALALGAALVAAPRTGQPADAGDEIGDLEPPDPGAALRRLLRGDDANEPTLGTVEVIRGDQRDTVTVPRAAAPRDER